MSSMLRKSAPLPFKTWNPPITGDATTPSTDTPATSQLPECTQNSPTRRTITLDGRWRIDSEVLGQGAFSMVRKGYDLKENQTIAVKVVDKAQLKERDRALVAREIRVWQTLQHPNIARMLGHQEVGGKIYIFMEYFAGGDLLSLAIREPRFVQMKARKFFLSILSAVEYLHKRGIAHRDLKLENILLSENNTRVAITDFGLCDMLANEPFDVYCGSPAYAAPELVTRTPYRGEPVDMWALGVILYTLVASAYPFDAEDIPTLYARIIKSTPRFGKTVPPKAIPVIEGLLQKDPTQRWTIADVRDADWLRGSFVGALRTAARGLFTESRHVKTNSM